MYVHCPDASEYKTCQFPMFSLAKISHFEAAGYWIVRVSFSCYLLLLLHNFLQPNSFVLRLFDPSDRFDNCTLTSALSTQHNINGYTLINASV